MSLFKKEEVKSISVEEMIANKILEQPDRLKTLSTIFDKLPENLVTQFNYILNIQTKTKTFAEVDIGRYVSLSMDVLPGDIIIRKNSDPELNDLIEISVTSENDYSLMKVKVIKINLKDGTLFVQDPLDPDISGKTSFKNVTCVIKTIKYTDPEWEKLIQALSIDYDISELIESAENSLEYVKNNDFHDKENTLKRLETRLEELNKRRVQ
jgi:hypothetical protein